METNEINYPVLNNKHIAKFMELESSDGVYFEYLTREGNRSEVTHFTSLKYHTSWDWLMPVVDKIEHTSAYVNIKGCHVKISTWVDVNAPTKLEAVYKAVVEFIKRYNKN